MQYYIAVNGQSVGPMSAEQMMSYNVDPNTPVSKDGKPWAPLYTFPELMQAYQQHNTSTNRYAGAVNDLSTKKLLCGIMAILFGTLGIQYFILGKVQAGLLTILLSLVTCGIWPIVMFIQGIYMLCMSDSDFARKYVNNPAMFPLF